MSNIEWGPEIAVKGVRPAWLADDDLCMIGMDGHAPCGSPHSADTWGWRSITSFRLPADHFAYKAIAGGFEPWGGGDRAPEDWDGGEVLDMSGNIGLPDHDAPNWKPIVSDTPYGGRLNIIGYRKRAQPKSDADTVTIQRMTEGQVHARWAGIHESVCDHGVRMRVLRDLGIIRPETTEAERIAADTGIDLATVERVLEAAR